jgi:F-type H+-transporting ATPase subunit gamma
MDALAGLQTKIDGAKDLKSVVKSMKAMAAANIGQYQLAVSSLGDYYHTVTLGMVAYLKQKKKIDIGIRTKASKKNEQQLICAIVFGSDQGLVGQFNYVLADFVCASLKNMSGKKQIWGVGERVQLLLSDSGLNTTRLFAVPGSVGAITPLVVEILKQSEEAYNKNTTTEFYVFHNQPKAAAGYEPVYQQLLPLDERWRDGLNKLKWPAKMTPQLIGAVKPTLLAFIREYLFVSLFKACAESLATENTSRLEAMQRAEKNIGELLDDLDQKFHRLRQSSIDEELFDVVSGFESLKK